MSWLYLPVRGGACSEQGCLDGEQSVTSSGTSIVSRCSKRGSETDISTMPRSGMTLIPSTGDPGLDWWMSCLRASHASHSQAREKDLERMIRGINGLPRSGSFAKFDPSSSSWKMSQLCWPSLISEEFLRTWPRAGMSSGGIAYRLQPLARIIRGTGSGSLPTPTVATGSYQRNPKGRRIIRYSLYGMARHNLWPTPRNNSGADMSKKHLSLDGAVKIWPTPTVQDSKQIDPPCHRNHKRHTPYLGSQVNQSLNMTGGMLNPNWVEWLMGWPIGWSALEPLEKDRFQRWLELHGKNCQNER